MLHALVIGIDNFESPYIRALRCARKDAAAVAGLLGRIPADELRVRTLLDEEATQRKVAKAMDDLARAAQEGDVALVYIASHGMPERRAPVAAPSAFIILHDTEYGHVHATAFDLELHVVDWMKRLEKPSVVAVVLDLCFSGVAGGRTFKKTHLDGEPLPPVSLKGLDLGEGRVILTAADENEVAREDDALGHGVFTHHLLAALQPPAGGPSAIGLGTLYEQVARAVQTGTSGKQHPIMNGRSNLAALPLFPR